MSRSQVALLLLATAELLGVPVLQSPLKAMQINRKMLLKAHVIEYPLLFLPPTLNIAKKSLLRDQ